jgi:hypothetical protein
MESVPNSKEPNIDELKSIDTGLQMVNFGWGNAKTLTEIKPILKSIKKLDDLLADEFSNYREGMKHNEKLIDLFFYEKIHTEEPLSEIDLSILPYNCIEWIFENHYDYFGLINAGLATELP